MEPATIGALCAAGCWLTAPIVIGGLLTLAGLVRIVMPLDEIDPVSAQAVRLPVGARILWVTPWALRGVPALRRGGWRLFGGVAVATVLSSTAPLFAVPLGIVFLGERLPVLAMLGSAVTVAGIVVLRL